MKEIILYSSLYGYSAADFISQLNDNKDSDIVIRMNTSGGNPEAAWGMIAKMSERTKKTKIKVDGKAHSMGAFMLAYSNDVEALDVSEFLIHRAAYASWVESDPQIMTEEMRTSLERVNSKLRQALEAKINVDEFAKLTGKTMDDVFNLNSRVDVMLTAEQAEKIGLIDKVVTITPQKKAELQGYYALAASSYENVEPLAALKVETPKTEKVQTIKNKAMTATELKANRPELYAEVYNAGISQERDRVGAYLAYADVDLEACSNGIKSGENMSQTMAAELTRKAMSKQFLASSESGSPESVVTTEPAATVDAKEAELEAAFAEAREMAKQ